MLNGAKTFPLRNSQPAFEHLAGWHFRRTFHYSAARMAEKMYSPLSHLSPYPANEQELQLLEVQVLQALPVSEAGEPSELLENAESTR